MCGRRRQPALYAPPTAHLFGASPGCGHLHTSSSPYHDAHHYRHGCHPRPQTLTGLAINAIATVIENKNQERTARAAALTRSQQGIEQGQVDGVIAVDANRRGKREAYEAGRLDDLVRELSLNNNHDHVDEKDKSGVVGIVRAQQQRQPPPPPVHEGEAPPAYTPTPDATILSPTAGGDEHAAIVVDGAYPASALVLTTPLLARYASHPIIVADLENLEVAIQGYRSRRCGGACAVKRARKQLVRDLGLLEAERLRSEGFGRREVKRAARDVWREGRW